VSVSVGVECVGAFVSVSEGWRLFATCANCFRESPSVSKGFQ
jgi:hypothetical protein